MFNTYSNTLAPESSVQEDRKLRNQYRAAEMDILIHLFLFP